MDFGFVLTFSAVCTLTYKYVYLFQCYLVSLVSIKIMN